MRTVLHYLLISCTGYLLMIGGIASAEELAIHPFETRQLSDVYFSEGAGAGDLDGDGHVDIVCGPYWYRGPDFQASQEIYPPVPQNRDGYADNFFSWVADFDRDGHQDVLVVGFPGTPAYVYRNPGSLEKTSQGSGDAATHWVRHQVLDSVSNESPQFTDLVGDEGKELVYARDGFFGYATMNPEAPLGPWKFHAISEQIAPRNFGHGLGVGDVNGDDRNDVIFSGGWLEQPAENPDQRWRLHEVAFSNSYGGADIHAYDVDGDGDNDVLTSHAAHDFGLGWYEQVRENGEISFKHHLIMGDRPEQNRYGLVISELHSVALADIDGDGLKDLVTGKTYWSHHRQSPMWDADPVVYWFRLVRGDDGIDWVPYRAGSVSGIGRQLSVADLNGDQLPDFVVGGMKGAHALIQSRRVVEREEWQSHQPVPIQATSQRTDRGAAPQFDEQGNVAGAIEGEAMRVVSCSGGETSIQPMSGFRADRWSGNAQLFWRQAGPGSRLTLEFDVAESGEYELSAVMTSARDYAIVNLLIDDAPLATSIDLYEYPDVKTTGEVSLGSRTLDQGPHQLIVESVGANPSAIPAHMFGLDYLVLKKR